MSNLNFVMIGKLSIAPDRENRKAFSDKLLDSGCNIRTLNLNMKCDKDSFNLQIKSFMNNVKRTSDGTLNVNDSTIYTILDNDGKYESTNFKYKDKDKYEDRIANFRKLVFVDENEERVECSNEFDYSMAVHSILKSDAYKDKKFKVQGNIEYSSYTNPKTHEEKIYTNYNVQRIYVINDEAEEKALANVEFYITEDCLDDSRLEEENLLVINGYIPEYNSKKKADIGFYQSFEYPLGEDSEKAKKMAKLIDKMLLDNFDDNELCKMGYRVRLINRREEVPFNEDMLSDEEKELVKYGLMDIEDLKQQYGAGMGSMQRRMEISSIGRGYSKGAIPVPLTLNELLSKGNEPKPELLDEDGDLDILSDDDDDEDELFDF
jgi:hypothetical protein|nr:MAG TPA: hypothetical protein [Caudoviricetes sp.]